MQLLTEGVREVYSFATFFRLVENIMQLLIT
jgi:hypothetical protein